MDIKALRNAQRLTLRELSESTGVSESYICSIENGKRRPSVAVAKRIAAVLGFEWTEFFEEGAE